MWHGVIQIWKLADLHILPFELLVDRLGLTRKRAVVVQNQDSSSLNAWVQVFEDNNGRFIYVCIQVQGGNLQFRMCFHVFWNASAYVTRDKFHESVATLVS